MSPDPQGTPLAEPDPAVVAEFWQRYVATGQVPEDTPVPTVECFGDTVELADKLIELVVDGPKRATAGSVLEYEEAGAPLPAAGDRWIATDGRRRPRCVLETTDIRVGPLSSVDDRFAWDEGEGDRTRAGWLADHTDYFRRVLGDRFHPDVDVVFERFIVRYVED